jgi:hypothetical protein
MTENSPDENPDDSQLTAEQDMVTGTHEQEQAVTLADVLAVQEGDAIAVRTARESTEWILAGRAIASADDAETTQAIEQRVEECASTNVLSIEADTWWALSDGDIIDQSHELDDRPQMQEYLDRPPKDPPACSLAYWETGRIGLMIPMPVHNGSRVIYYAADDYGTLLALTHGAAVQPEQLLPDTFTPL